VGNYGYITLRRRLEMAIYKTKYFGDFEVEDDNDLIEIETTVKDGREDKEVSIVIHYSDTYKARMGEIIQLLDRYFELHEAAKRYIGKNYEKNDDMVDFLFKYAGQLGKKEYMRNGNKTFTVDIDTMIEKLDPPTVGFQEYRNGEMAAQLQYFGPVNTDASLIITIDKDCKVYSVDYYGEY
jgi:hypothetical protein